jgi:hypothetical protein
LSTRPGVPLVDPAVTCGSGGGSVSVSQHVPDSSHLDHGHCVEDVCLVDHSRVLQDVKSRHRRDTVLDTAPASVRVDSCPTWVMANAGARGYYRVVYSPEMIRSLAACVDALSPTERIALAADEWALVRDGRHDIGTFMGPCGRVSERTDTGSADTLLDSLRPVGRVVTDDASRPKYRAWVASLLKPAMDEVGWTPRAGEKRTAARSFISALGHTARDPETIQTARRMVLAHLDSSNNNEVDSTLLNALVGVAAIDGDASLYDRYLTRSKQARDPEEHYRYLYCPRRLQRSCARAPDDGLHPRARRSQSGYGRVFGAPSRQSGRSPARVGAGPDTVERPADEDRSGV